MSSRTGTAAVFITSKSHINDIINPAAFETNNALGFCKKVLGHALADVGGRLEAFNLVNSKGKCIHAFVLKLNLIYFHRISKCA